MMIIGEDAHLGHLLSCPIFLSLVIRASDNGKKEKERKTKFCCDGWHFYTVRLPKLA